MVPNWKDLVEYLGTVLVGAGAVYALGMFGHSFGEATPFVTAGAATAVHYVKGLLKS